MQIPRGLKVSGLYNRRDTVVKRCTLSLLVVIAMLSVVGLTAAQEPQIADCPTIFVSCPASIDSHSVIFTANVASVPNARYIWTVSSGTITQGQGTTAIRVAVGSSRSITATIEVIGFPKACGNTASCSIIGEEWVPKARKFDEYRLACKARSSRPGTSKRWKLRRTAKRVRPF